MYEGSCWSEQTDLTAVDLKFNILLHQFVPTNTHFDVNLLLVCNLQCLMGVGSHYWTLAAIFVSMIAAKSLIGWALFRIMGSVVLQEFFRKIILKSHWLTSLSIFHSLLYRYSLKLYTLSLKINFCMGKNDWDFYFQYPAVALHGKTAHISIHFCQARDLLAKFVHLMHSYFWKWLPLHETQLN